MARATWPASDPEVELVERAVDGRKDDRRLFGELAHQRLEVDALRKSSELRDRRHLGGVVRTGEAGDEPRQGRPLRGVDPAGDPEVDQREVPRLVDEDVAGVQAAQPLAEFRYPGYMYTVRQPKGVLTRAAAVVGLGCAVLLVALEFGSVIIRGTLAEVLAYPRVIASYLGRPRETAVNV